MPIPLLLVTFNGALAVALAEGLAIDAIRFVMPPEPLRLRMGAQDSAPTGEIEGLLA